MNPIDIAVIDVDPALLGPLGTVTVLRDVTAQTFDGSTHTWALQTAAGPRHARIVISQRAADSPLRPYRGVAVHGRPNWFFISDSRQAAYVRDCLTAMDRDRATRIEVRHSTQRLFHDRPAPWPTSWRRRRELRRRIPEDFDLDSAAAGVSDEVYDGPATLHMAGADRAVHVRLTGHLDPIDGRYHWRGTILDVHDAVSGSVTLTVGDRTADARITERTAQGTFSIAGVGAPPFVLDDVEVTVPG
ncbi:DUF4873 domain-containing protein [Mycolicibacterium mageritense]|uniref:DUF4873 domain-containing protein n=1 Tax=Mycolicibacterium mageritense TaxID=53462 RepID=UPI001E42A303|nr:DUF4873 domain-containing protein [Mycolicibacterium mageritense]GJJ23299.1 hypothetical protein MTY414_69720 [Mycolicibacterium mageritense]